MPKDRYFENKSLELSDIFIPLYIIVKNNADTIIIPRKPSSSLIIENIKSVCGSGR